MLQESPTTGEATSSMFLDSPTAAQVTSLPIRTLLLLNFCPWLHPFSSISPMICNIDTDVLKVALQAPAKL